MHPLSFRPGQAAFPLVYEPAFDFPAPRFTFPDPPCEELEHRVHPEPEEPHWEEFVPRWWPGSAPTEK
jgi:hypothetical protein